MKRMPDSTLKVAMAQMLVEPGNPGTNLSRAEEMIKQAAERGCRVVVLPECLDFGWMDDSARERACPIPGNHAEILSEAARAAGIYVAAGLVERDGAHLYNAAVLFSPSGDILLKHRKINELSIALGLYTVGDSLGVARTPDGAFGLNICADNFPDSLELGISQARIGAQLLLSPSAWAVPPDHDNERNPYGDLWRGAYTELARRAGVATVGVSNVGPVLSGAWQGWKCIGCSLAVGADGRILAQGPYGVGASALICVDVPLERPLNESVRASES